MSLGMTIILFLIGLVLGSFVVQVFALPAWIAGPVIGVYIWWMINEEAE